MYLYEAFVAYLFVGIGGFFGIAFTVASDKDVEGAGMGYPLSPSSVVCIPHRTRIVNANSSATRIVFFP
jgi:hypothetical protein